MNDVTVFMRVQPRTVPRFQQHLPNYDFFILKELCRCNFRHFHRFSSVMGRSTLYARTITAWQNASIPHMQKCFVAPNGSPTRADLPRVGETGDRSSPKVAQE